MGGYDLAKITNRQLPDQVSRASIGRRTFGDADRPQDAVDEEDAVQALSVNFDLSKKVLGVGRAPLRFEDLVEMVEVLHLGCGLPTSSLWIDKLDEPRQNRGRCCAMRCDAQAGELPAETEAIAYRDLLRDLHIGRRLLLTQHGGSMRHVWPLVPF